MTNTASSSGMRTFIIIWLGQVVSILGSGLTTFALGVWLYQSHQSATLYGLMPFFMTAPGLVVGLFAGTLIDRWDRRRVLIGSDLGSGLSTLALAALFFSGSLALWHIYLVMAIQSICNSFRIPAFATIPGLVVPKQHQGRAAGLILFADASASLIAPLLGSVLFQLIGISNVLLLDVVSFVFSMSVVLSIRLPLIAERPALATGGETLLEQTRYGWTYLISRPGLRSLTLLGMFRQMMMGVVFVAATPLVLTIATVQTLGVLQALGGVGALIGSTLMSAWGGPKRRVYGMLGAELIGGLCLIVAGLAGTLPVYGAIILIYYLRMPISLVCNQAILLAKVPTELQGRVFSVVRTLALSSMPLAYLFVGPLIDQVFNPLFATNGPLTGTLIDQIFGLGAGRGISALFLVMGLLSVLASIVGWSYRPLRTIDDETPAQAASAETDSDSFQFPAAPESASTAVK